jgi:hypothetical protein
MLWFNASLQFGTNIHSANLPKLVTNEVALLGFQLKMSFQENLWYHTLRITNCPLAAFEPNSIRNRGLCASLNQPGMEGSKTADPSQSQRTGDKFWWIYPHESEKCKGWELEKALSVQIRSFRICSWHGFISQCRGIFRIWSRKYS